MFTYRHNLPVATFVDVTSGNAKNFGELALRLSVLNNAHTPCRDERWLADRRNFHIPENTGLEPTGLGFETQLRDKGHAVAIDLDQLFESKWRIVDEEVIGLSTGGS